MDSKIDMGLADRIHLQKERVQKVCDVLTSARMNQGLNERVVRWAEDELLCINMALGRMEECVQDVEKTVEEMTVDHG
jgi:hypothetical protein